MGTTGGARDQVYANTEDANLYVITVPSMGKQIVALQAFPFFFTSKRASRSIAFLMSGGTRSNKLVRAKGSIQVHKKRGALKE